MESKRRVTPTEVVLAAPLYALLIAEVIGLAWLYATQSVSASSTLGRSIGWIGIASMLAMHVYSVRRRVGALRGWGPLRVWLQLHIFLGLQGALFVLFHSLHVHTFGNLAGITLALTVIVVCSGIFGRYLFSIIPKTLSGERMTATEIEDELRATQERISAKHKAAGGEALGYQATVPATAAAVDAPTTPAILAAIEAPQRLDQKLPLTALIKEDLRTRRMLAELRRATREEKRKATSPEMAELAELTLRRGMLARRLAMLAAADRLFRNWTVLHKPLTYLLAGSAILHVIAHYIYAAQYGA